MKGPENVEQFKFNIDKLIDFYRRIQKQNIKESPLRTHNKANKEM